MFISVAQKHTLPLTFLVTGLSRLVLSVLRDELFQPSLNRSRDDVLEEAGKSGVPRPIVSNRSLILSSFITLVSYAVDPHLTLPVAAATLGWESAGLIYNIVGRVYTS